MQKLVIAALLSTNVLAEKPEDVKIDNPVPMTPTEKLRDLHSRKESGNLKDTDAFKSLEEIAHENGFVVDKQEVITDDGYILGLYRIPGTLQNPSAQGKPAILLQHGLGASMMQWVFNRPEVAPAFVLARAGYDVWLGNNRGTMYSDQHASLDNTSYEYWNFDWEDMGTKDTPAVIKAIKLATGADKISYAGHSEGTTQIMAGAALMPQFYKDNLNVAVFMAPPASMKHNTVEFMRFLSEYINRQILEGVLNTIHLWNLLPYNFLNTGVATAVCQLFDGALCDAIMSTFADEDPSIDYTERYDVYMSNEPAGSGWRNYIHYGQLMHHDHECFKRYDYDSDKANMAHYNQTTPPDYDLKALDFPIAIFSGSKDLLADPEDVKWTAAQLNNTLVFNHEYYLGHMSFAIAKDMSWFTVDAMAILHMHNGKEQETCAAEFDGTNFAARHEFCQTFKDEAEKARFLQY